MVTASLSEVNGEGASLEWSIQKSSPRQPEKNKSSDEDDDDVAAFRVCAVQRVRLYLGDTETPLWSQVLMGELAVSER